MVLEKDLSRKENTPRDDEEEISGSGILKIFHGISGYDRFFSREIGIQYSLMDPFLGSVPISCLFLSINLHTVVISYWYQNKVDKREPVSSLL